MTALSGQNRVIGYDSTRPELIPLGAQCVFPYIDGIKSRWNMQAYPFPHAYKKTITVLGNQRADIADVERYDLSLEGGINWGRGKYADTGVVPCLYSSIDSLGYLASGMTGVPVHFFVADPTSIPHMYDIPGCVATQFAWLGKFDLSLVDLDWLNGHIMNPNTPSTLAPCIGGKLTPSGKGYYLFGADGGVFAYGDAIFRGSMYGKIASPDTRCIGFDVMPDNSGYVLFGDQYGVWAFGKAPMLGHP
ncbi:MAG: hypothetical protein KGL39_52875 [Patescibacteria group bacterium]|nr:hypothetical protein [Patescibacteria group bacterium]